MFEKKKMKEFNIKKKNHTMFIYLKKKKKNF